MTRVALYLRQSLDKSGEGLGVERQEAECRRLCERRGWHVSEVVTDNDRSASVGTRPGYERLKRLIEHREVDVVVVLRVDRLLRKLTDLEAVIELVERTGVNVVTVEGDLQLDTPAGRLNGRILASVARAEIETKSARQKLANQQKAARGLPHGCRRVFGYESDGMTIKESEAEIVRILAQKFINGWSYKELSIWLNEQGIRSTQGNKFRAITLRDIIIRKRYAGIREHNGTDYKAAWPAIYDEVTWARVQHAAAMRREKPGNKERTRKYLLTGFLYCSKCGKSLNGTIKRDGENWRRIYICKVQSDLPNGRGCGGVMRATEPLEHFIRELIVYRLDTEVLAELAKPSRDITPLLAHKASAEAQLDLLLESFADGTLTKPEYIKAKSHAQKRLETTLARLEALGGSGLVAGLRAGENVRERWKIESDGWRRALMDVLIERVEVKPGSGRPWYVGDNGRRYKFDTSLIDVTWKV